MNKKCKKCGIEKSTEFFLYRKDIGKFRATCKECENNTRKERYYKKNNSINKLCKNCNCIITNRHNNIKYCKKCRDKQKNIYSKKFYSKNKEKILEYSKNWEEKNKEKRTIQKKEYQKKYKKDIRKYQNKWKTENKKYKENRAKQIREKRKNDPAFRLKENMSRHIRTALKKNNVSKNRKSYLDYIGYTIQELKQHIELLFESWMNWDNQDRYLVKNWDDNDPSTWKWQIDHIIPQEDLPYTSMEDENFKKCWGLSNLRPLSAKQNQLDGARRIRHKNNDYKKPNRIENENLV